MSSKLFVYTKRDGSYTEPKPMGAVIKAARNRLLVSLAPFTITQDGDAITSALSRAKTIRRLQHILEVGDIGPTYRVRNKRRVIFTVREVKPAILVPDDNSTSGNAKADACWNFVKLQFKNINYLGAYVCKHIAGTWTMSQHSYGNAVDIGAPTMAELEDIADYIVTNADLLSVEHCIVNKRIWTRGEGWHYYSGQTHYHVHTDFNPQYSGSCGVRG